MLDVHLAESYAQNKLIDSAGFKIKNQDSLNYYYALIFKKNKITQEQFKYNINYYNKQPILFDSIYEMVMKDISILKAQNL